MKSNVIKMIWNLENLTLDDFGLYAEDNMLSAPICPCGCGEKSVILLDDEDDVIGFCYAMVENADCEHCVTFAITDQNYMIAAVRYEDDINIIRSKKPLDNYSAVGVMFGDLGFHMFGLIVSVGNGQYKIVEE